MEPPADIAETHSSVVFFVGDRAYKLKKPLDLGFLDHRTRPARARSCHREVELNQRLAPDVYLGVADICGPDGQLSDHLVVMRRLPTERRLSTLVTEGQSCVGHLWQLAHLMATFHAGSPRSPQADHAAGAAATRDRWDANTEEMRATHGPIDASLIERVDTLANAYLKGREPLFHARIADGRAVDGHGDLLADDIFCLADGPRVLDCLDFDEQLRFGDGLADVAFLAMDLERLGRPDLGRYFLDAYREHRGDAWPASLVHHHIAYRAQVRAKVTAIRALQGDPQAGDAAIDLMQLAIAHLEAGKVRLILVGGLPGTGKSTLASGLGRDLHAAVLRSDAIRKELAGIPETTSAPAPFARGIYAPGSTARTYQTMLDRARIALTMGETVVLDASWIDGRWRARARQVGAAAYAEMVELRCQTTATVAADRMALRLERGGDPSDATPEIAGNMGAAMDGWPEAVAIDTSGEPAIAREAARGLLAPPA